MYSILPRMMRRRVWWVISISTISGLMQMTSIASVMPFMTVVAKPKFIFTNPFLTDIYNLFGFVSTNSFLVSMGIVVMLILAVSNGVSATMIWLLTRTINLSGHLISKSLMASYLSQPYAFFLNRNTSELGKNILSEVSRVTNGTLGPVLRIISSAIIGTFILVLLIIVDPVLTATVALLVVGSYSIIYFLLRGKLAYIGKESSDTNTGRYQSASEALSGIKDIKLSGRESDFLERFSVPSEAFAKYESQKRMVEHLPRYFLETILFGGMLIIIIYLLSTKHYIQKTIPLTALYAYAGYRLMPVLQQIFAGFSSIRYHSASLELLYDDLNSFADKNTVIAPVSKDAIQPMHLENSLNIVNVCFTYPGSDRQVINNLNATIHSNSTVGIVGKTGCGKTTIIDLMLGLLQPGQGEILVDGIPLSEANTRSWQRTVGYVPQEIYLSDDSIAHNIAFGISDEKIDMDSVRKAAEIANIDQFIQHELSDGYDTLVGERGVRLSGGQRQRIGIARALYSDPDLIVLDEATSALDGVTENVVMDAIKNLYHKKTVIIVAHRLATVKGCDDILLVDQGRIVQSGSYEFLVDNSSRFQELVKMSLL